MSDTLKTILTIVFSGAGFTFIQFLIQRYDARSDKYNQLSDKIEEQGKAIEELRDKVDAQAESQAKDNAEQARIIRANSELLVGLGQYSLVHLTDKYQRRGAITLHELSILEEIYAPYHDKLHGNGRGKAGIELCRKLKVVSDAEAMRMDKEVKAV